MHIQSTTVELESSGVGVHNRQSGTILRPNDNYIPQRAGLNTMLGDEITKDRCGNSCLTNAHKVTNNHKFEGEGANFPGMVARMERLR